MADKKENEKVILKYHSGGKIVTDEIECLSWWYGGYESICIYDGTDIHYVVFRNFLTIKLPPNAYKKYIPTKVIKNNKVVWETYNFEESPVESFTDQYDNRVEIF